MKQKFKRNYTTKCPTERQECIWFYQWICLNPCLRECTFHIPNEGKRSPITGHILKLMGMVKGALDYVIFEPNLHYHSLWLEIKVTDRSKAKISQDQQIMINNLNKRGHYAKVAYGWQDAANITERYLLNAVTP